ncbi:MAG: hypothetical protein GF421_12955 [Candidatus Aminicenantes bacterium]|nr:hypothetical protein [Candidatus Aminicenantes bacterium]
MEKQLSKGYRFFYVVFNLAMLGLTVFSLMWTVIGENRILFLFPGFVALGLLLWSMIKIYFKTGVWSFVHRKSEHMDERELTVARKSLQKAYSIFAVVVLSLIVLSLLSITIFDSGTFIAENTSGLWIVVAGLIYLAHSLPAAVIVLQESRLDFK